MAFIRNGYLIRRTNSKKKSNAKTTTRNWWLVKWDSFGRVGKLSLHGVCFPKTYVGKKVRFKVEVME